MTESNKEKEKETAQTTEAVMNSDSSEKAPVEKESEGGGWLEAFSDLLELVADIFGSFHK